MSEDIEERLSEILLKAIKQILSQMCISHSHHGNLELMGYSNSDHENLRDLIGKTLSMKSPPIIRRSIKLYGGFMEFLRHKDTENAKVLFKEYV